MRTCVDLYLDSGKAPGLQMPDSGGDADDLKMPVQFCARVGGAGGTFSIGARGPAGSAELARGSGEIRFGHKFSGWQDGDARLLVRAGANVDATTSICVCDVERTIMTDSSAAIDETLY